MPNSFDHITTWVFDLDNTLYPPEVRLFDQIEVRMTKYVMDALQVDRLQADHLRKHYWANYGTTLAGLMDEHDIDPGPYLHEVHDISFDALEPDQALRNAISELPGRKIIYTNGTASYAANVANARGLEGAFDAIYGVEEAGFRPKPEKVAFETIASLDGFNPALAAMFEDDVRNLEAPKALGMRTIHVAPTPDYLEFVDFHTDDLPQFLNGLQLTTFTA